jgi:ketosteroid isomerase-like protein
MTVYRKQRDGRWLLSRDVHTLSAVAYTALEPTPTAP